MSDRRVRPNMQIRSGCRGRGREQEKTKCRSCCQRKKETAAEEEQEEEEETALPAFRYV